MQKLNIRDVRVDERFSPKRKFGAYTQQISVALGRDGWSEDLAKRHPFDVTLFRVPPKSWICPYHLHTAQWEFYLVISGVGTVREESGNSDVSAGDAFYFPPRVAHQIGNFGTDDFVYYVIADNPIGDTCYYPDSGKATVYRDGEYTVVKTEPADYFDGEE